MKWKYFAAKKLDNPANKRIVNPYSAVSFSAVLQSVAGIWGQILSIRKKHL